MYSQLPFKRVNAHFVQSGWSRSGNNPPLGDALSILAYQLDTLIAQYRLTDSLEILEQEGIPKYWGIMLLPLIHQQMGGKN